MPIIRKQQKITIDPKMYYPGDRMWIPKKTKDLVNHWYAKQRVFYENALSAFNIQKFQGNVLNLGCGGGALSCLLSNDENMTIGVDLFKGVVKFQRDRACYHQLEIEGIACDGLYLPFKPSSFDFILSQDVLEHSKNPYQLLSEIFRVLIPGGGFFFSIPNKLNILSSGHSNWKNQLKKKLGKKVDYEYLFTSRLIKNTLKKIGFEAIEFYTQKILLPFQLIFLRRGWKILARK